MPSQWPPPDRCVGGGERERAIGRTHASCRPPTPPHQIFPPQVDEALECYTNALEIDESHAPSVSNRGNCLRHLGKLQEAERDYQLAIEMDPSNAKSFANRGALLRQQGKNVRALDDFRR